MSEEDNILDLYGILGVDKKATLKVIKKAYKDKAKKSHPDVGGDEEEFKKLKGNVMGRLKESPGAIGFHTNGPDDRQ